MWKKIGWIVKWQGGIIIIGDTYKIKQIESGKELTFTIVGSYWDGSYVRTGSHIDSFGDGTGTAYNYEENIVSDADPTKGTISEKSPMGEKLLESRTGDIITVNGHKYKVLDIFRNK